MNQKTNVHSIMTPEGITFSFQLACPVNRFAAWIIDFAAISVLTSFIGSLIQVFEIINKDITIAILIGCYFIISIGYPIILEWRWRGQTVGKRLLRLRVIDAEGYRLQFSQIVLRNLLRFIDSLPMFYFIGGLSCLITKKAQRLGDLSANTLVMRIPVISEPDLNQILPDKYNSLRDYPHLIARLRQQVSPQEAAIAVKALFRRDELKPQARTILFNKIASYFKTIVTFPQEATDGISDEQYVRNIVEVLFNLTCR